MANQSRDHKTKIKPLRSVKMSERSLRFLVVIGFAIVGTILLIRSQAATPVVSIEIGASANAPATVVSPSTGASGGSAVRFGQSAPRTYPLHTNIVATTFWAGETFRDAPDGDQTCSAYDSKWAEHWGAVGDTIGTRRSTSDCGNVPYGGCDSSAKKVVGTTLTCEAEVNPRVASNNYLPSWASSTKKPRENHFYLDLPFNDAPGSGEGYADRCTVIPWRNDPGYAGRCTTSNFSYMKNRWVKLIKGANVCYGQISDAGPADDNDSNPNGLRYRDAPYVFGVDTNGTIYNNVRPNNKSFGPTSAEGAGVDVSPALNSCLGFADRDGNSDKVSWQWVEATDVPKDGPWAITVTTTLIDGVVSSDPAYISSLTPTGL